MPFNKQKPSHQTEHSSQLETYTVGYVQKTVYSAMQLMIVFHQLFRPRIELLAPIQKPKKLKRLSYLYMLHDCG